MKTLPFYVPEAWEKDSFWYEPPCIRCYSQCSPPPDSLITLPWPGRQVWFHDLVFSSSLAWGVVVRLIFLNPSVASRLSWGQQSLLTFDFCDWFVVFTMTNYVLEWGRRSALVFIRERRLSSVAFTSNCSLSPLNLNSEADLSMLDWSSISFPLASSCVLKYPLNKVKNCTHQLWTQRFTDLGFSKVSSLLFPQHWIRSRTSQRIKRTANPAETGTHKRVLMSI